MSVCARAECSSECVSECWSAALSAPACLEDCAESHSIVLSLILALPFILRTLEYFGEQLLEKANEARGGRGRSGSKAGKGGKYRDLEKGGAGSPNRPRGRSRSGSGANRPRSPSGSGRSNLKPDPGKTMSAILEKVPRKGHWAEVADKRDMDGLVLYGYAGGRLLFCHILQPVAYGVGFSLAYNDLSEHPLPFALAACVAVREALYLLATVGCVLVNPAFLLVDLDATAEDEFESFLSTGKTSIVAYLATPVKLVALALLGKGGLNQKMAAKVVVLGTSGLDLCCLAALGAGLGASILPLYLTVFFSATLAGAGATVFLLFTDDDLIDSRLGAVFGAMAGLAFGGSFMVENGSLDSEHLSLTSPVVIVAVAEAGLAYFAYTLVYGDDDDDDDSDDEEESSDEDDDCSDEDEDEEDDDDYRTGDEIEVYSNSSGKWCSGTVTKEEPSGAGTVQVEYTNASNALMTKVLQADSKDLRKVKKQTRTRRNSGGGGRSPKRGKGGKKSVSWGQNKSSDSPRSPQRSTARTANASALERELTRKESDRDFKYTVRAVFRKAGDTGFTFEEGDGGEVIVNKIKKRSMGSKVEHACEGMILYALTSGTGRQKETIFLDDDPHDYDELLDRIAEDDRPLELVFEHPWQKDGRSYFNSWTEEEEDDRPQELEDVYRTMQKQEAGGGRDDRDDGSALSRQQSVAATRSGRGDLARTSTVSVYECRVTDTRETGTFTYTTRYKLRCKWNGLVGDCEKRYSDFKDIDGDMRNRIPANRRDDLPVLPSSDESSTDPDVVEKRKAWIENYLQLSFQFLDEAMSTRTTKYSDNSWETFTFAKNWLSLRAANNRGWIKQGGTHSGDPESWYHPVDDHTSWIRPDVLVGTG